MLIVLANCQGPTHDMQKSNADATIMNGYRAGQLSRSNTCIAKPSKPQQLHTQLNEIADQSLRCSPAVQVKKQARKQFSRVCRLLAGRSPTQNSVQPNYRFHSPQPLNECGCCWPAEAPAPLGMIACLGTPQLTGADARWSMQHANVIPLPILFAVSNTVINSFNKRLPLPGNTVVSPESA